jgi:hypothetical protein
MPQHKDRDDENEDRHEHRHDDNSDKKGILYNVIGGILIAGCCWSLGYGYSQSTLGAAVTRVSMSVEHVRELQIADRKSFEDADLRLSKEIAAGREASSEHMKSVVALMQKVTEQNQELIAFLRAELVHQRTGQP